MATEEAQKVLAEEILRDAQRRANDILSEAKAKAETILSGARATAQSEAAKILEEHRVRARKRAAMTLRTVEQEVARRKLHARDEVVQAALEELGLSS